MTNGETHLDAAAFAEEVAAKIIARLGAGAVAADQDVERLLPESEAAEILSVKGATLAKWRCIGDGPAFVKIGVGEKRPAIRYLKSDLLSWARARRFRNTGSQIEGDDNG